MHTLRNNEPNRFVIVENAGYENETDLPWSHKTAEKAWRKAKRWYKKDELESLHVQVVFIRLDGTRTYEY